MVPEPLKCWCQVFSGMANMATDPDSKVTFLPASFHTEVASSARHGCVLLLPHALVGADRIRPDDEAARVERRQRTPKGQRGHGAEHARGGSDERVTQRGTAA